MRGPIHVLLTDDDEDYAEALTKVLVRRGMEVRTVHDGRAAVAACAAREFDVILLDLRMPGMDGVATLHEIRALDALTPVLIVSAHAELPRASEALRLGAADYILKPCPVDDLVAAIEDASERKAYARALAEGRPGG